MRMLYATRKGLVVEPQNHPTLHMAGFDRVWASKLGGVVLGESEAARGVIAKGVSRRSNFVWSALRGRSSYPKQYIVFNPYMRSPI
jgi:hypothetical protein